MNNCNELLEKFYKSTNNNKFEIHYNWDLRPEYKPHHTRKTGWYNGESCNMDVETEKKLKRENRIENCVCLDDWRYMIPSAADIREVKKN
jgi:hypothetical protein